MVFIDKILTAQAVLDLAQQGVELVDNSDELVVK